MQNIIMHNVIAFLLVMMASLFMFAAISSAQCIVAIPMIVLYEASILAARAFG